MRSYIKKFLAMTLCVLSLSLSSYLTAFADGTTMIYLSEKDIGVGDTLKMTVSGSEKSTITVRYNASVLNFSNCDAAGYTTNGNAITFSGKSAVITFKAASEGKSNLIVASDKLTGASTAVNVGGGSSAASSDNDDDENATQTSQQTDNTQQEEDTQETDQNNSTADDASDSQSSENGDFSYNGITYVVSERFKDSEVPAGFTKKTLEIHGKSYNEPVNDTMTLLYLKPASNTSGSGEFYVYDTENDSVSPMQLVGDNEKYVILIPPGSLLKSNMTEAEIKVGDKTYKGYRIGDIENDFYFIYGMNESQTVDWYQYDAASGTVQRVNTELLEMSASDDEASETEEGAGDGTEEGGKNSKSKGSFLETLQSKLGNVRLVLALLIFVLAVLVIVIIDLLVFRRNNDDDEVFGDDDEDEDGDIELIRSDKDGLLDVDEVRLEDDTASEPSASADAKHSAKASKSDTKRLSAGEDEEDEEEDDEEDKDEAPAKKKRPLFFRKKKQDDIWSEPDASETSLFDDDDEYEKFFRRVRSNNENGNDGDKVDVIDLNDL